MKRPRIAALVVLAASIFLVTLTLAAQDRSGVKVPDGLAFAEFKGYDTWQTIAPSQTPEEVKAILGNAVMITALKAGIPGNGKPVPDGAMMTKIDWLKQTNAVSPYPVDVPKSLKSVSFMIKDSKRFADSGGWGYAQFTYNTGSNSFTPVGTGSACGYTCHTKVKANDFVFTKYAPR
jgi:cytochrome P460